MRGVFYHAASYPCHSVFKCFVAQMSSKIIKCGICRMHGDKLLVRMAKLVKGLNIGDVRFHTRRHHQLDKGCCIEVIGNFYIPP